MKGITNTWISDQINLLLTKCPFQSKVDVFLLDPAEFYKFGDYKEQVRFLIKRYNLPYEDLNIYMHSGLKSGNRRCAGLARLPGIFDTAKLNLKAGQTVLTIAADGSCSVLDTSDSSNPMILKLEKAVPMAYRTPAIYLDQKYITSKEAMGAIIAHEVAHLYLYYHGLHQIRIGGKENDLSKEYLTDLATFVMGLGLVRLEGASLYNFQWVSSILDWITGDQSEGIGYLSFGQMKYAQAQVLKHFQAG